MTFGDRLKIARNNKGFTQRKLAEMIGVAKSTLAGYETGLREPDVFKIKRLSKALGVSADYLIGNETSADSFITDTELGYLQRHRLLNENGQKKVSEYMEDLLPNPKYKARENPTAVYKMVARNEEADITVLEDPEQMKIMDSLFVLAENQREEAGDE